MGAAPDSLTGSLSRREMSRGRGRVATPFFHGTFLLGSQMTPSLGAPSYLCCRRRSQGSGQSDSAQVTVSQCRESGFELGSPDMPFLVYHLASPHSELPGPQEGGTVPRRHCLLGRTHSRNSTSNSSVMFVENHSLGSAIWIPSQSSCTLVMLMLTVEKGEAAQR